jgi:hypothetical protein
MKDIKKNIIILLRISGTYTVLRLVFSFTLMPFIESHCETRCVDFIPFFLEFWHMFFGIYLIGFFSSYLTFVSVCIAIGTDFAYASNISKGNKKEIRITFYRTLITCLFGILLVILASLATIPGKFNPVLSIVEGFFYFLFYGTIFTLLMINERKDRL